MNNYALIVLDSCRYDVMRECWSSLKTINTLGTLRKAYSFTSWTLTSHIAMTLGRLPWIEERTRNHSQKTSLADLSLWLRRLGLSDSSLFEGTYTFKSQLNSLGYTFRALTSANPLGYNSPYVQCVDTLIHVGKQGRTLERIVPLIDPRPLSFYVINTCETHYPYFDGTGSPNALEDYYLPGFRAQVHGAKEGRTLSIPTFGKKLRQYMFDRQAAALLYIDSTLPLLLAALPPHCAITVTSDHGDCFGEGGYFGHGEVAHPKVLEVPFVEAFE